MSLFNLWMKAMKWMVISIPLVLAVVIIVVPLVDVLSPWPVAESALDEHARGGLAVCVGMSSRKVRTGKDIFVENQRSYLLVSMGTLATVSETQVNGERSTAVEMDRWGFRLILVFAAFLIWLSLRFSLPQIMLRLNPGRRGDGSE